MNANKSIDILKTNLNPDVDKLGTPQKECKKIFPNLQTYKEVVGNLCKGDYTL